MIPLRGNMIRDFFDIHIWGFFFFFFFGTPKDVVNLRCGTEEETSVHVTCGCEAFTLFRHTYLRSFLLDPEDVMNSNMGAI